MSGAEQFATFIRGLGFEPPASIKPGRFLRFGTNGKRGDDAGYAKLFPDGEGGIVGDFRTGRFDVWQGGQGKPANEAERRAWQETIEREKREAEAERERGYAEARESARQILEGATGDPATHPYIVAKKQLDFGQRAKRGAWPQRGWPDALLLPILQRDGVAWSVAAINADGTKDFLKGGKVGAGLYPFGKITGASRVLVGEGVATVAAAMSAVPGSAAAAALSAGNLGSVAKMVREVAAPNADIVILADNDPKPDGSNPGLAKATEAARIGGARLAVPNMGTRPCDFWDLWSERGAEAVGRVIRDARPPAVVEVSTRAPSALANANPASAEPGDGWPEALPLPEGLPAVAPFDFALLPDTLRPWAEDICERVQCPPDYVGVTIMTALGSVIGRRVGIRPQEKTDWTEYANQWGKLVGRPGVLKSPAMEAALSPLKRLAAQAAESHKVAIEDYQQAARLTKLRAEASEKAARAKLAKNPGADVSGDLVGDETESPTLKRYIANDTSAESLGELLRQNPNGLLVFRDELVSLLKGLDREENASARGFYLTGWSGSSPYTFDRIGRGLNLHVPAVCLSLLGSTQPGRIAEYLRAAVRGGAGDDGLVQRFGLLVWPDTAGEWRDVDRWPDSEARRAANAVFERLDKLDATVIGAETDEFDAVPFLRFDAEGLGLFREWREAWEAKLRGGELHPALESHLAKYRKLVPGLALSLHLANGSTGSVGKRPTLQALAWAEYLETHARRAYASVTSPEITAAKAILEKLRRGELSHTFAARDIYRHGWAHLSEREHVLDALQLLVDLDRLAVHVRDTGGRVATIYEANPRGLAA